MSEFYEIEPTLENYWRGIILFGKNVASYKFALAKSLYDMKLTTNDLVTLEELSAPFSKHICEHLLTSPKQATSQSSKFLNACSEFNAGKISHDDLITSTQRLGFNNVIDAFHNVHGSEIGKRFFIDERKSNKGIRLTDNFFQLTEVSQFNNLINETEARWRLVEESWRLGISRHTISVQYDDDLKLLFTDNKDRRITLTSCRDALNGYQKGKCFYCFSDISLNGSADLLPDVDHFLPWSLSDNIENINGVWNLVLACKDCNRGESGKFAKVPSLDLLARLHKRNEYFINSHLPLRETLILQTGKDEHSRKNFLQQQYNIARSLMIVTWEPEPKADKVF